MTLLLLLGCTAAPGATDTGDTAAVDTADTADTADTGRAPPTEDAWSVAANPRMTVAAIATIAVVEQAEIELEFTAEGTGTFRTQRSALGHWHTVDVLGMRAQTVWTLTPIVYRGGVEVSRMEAQTFTTGALPVGDFLTWPAVIQAGGDPGDIFLATPVTKDDPDFGLALLGYDREGHVVWYLDAGELVEELALSRFSRRMTDGTVSVITAKRTWFVAPDASVERNLTVSGVGHDVEVLPDGNVLTIQVEDQDIAGQMVRGNVIREYDKDDVNVWSWSTFDDLDTSRIDADISGNIEEIDVDWTHANRLYYDALRDEVLVSLRHQSWVVGVNHADASLAWRLGADGDFTLTTGTWFDAQHSAQLLADGSLLLFDNRAISAEVSAVQVLSLDHAGMIATEVVRFPVDARVHGGGDVEAMPNGNFLTTISQDSGAGHGPPRLEERTPAGELVWSLGFDVSGLIMFTGEHVPWRTSVP